LQASCKGYTELKWYDMEAGTSFYFILVDFIISVALYATYKWQNETNIKLN